MAAVQSIGERLREARMRQKIDVADVETATKIRAKYLRALENEEFGLLPGPTFVKTFLRTYAEYLGLDAQLLVEESRVQSEPRGEEIAPIGATSSGRSARRGRGGGGRGAGGGGRGVGPPGPGVVFGGIFLVLLAVIIILGLTADDNGSNGGGTQSSQQARDASAAKAKAKKRAAARKRRAAAKRRKARAAPKVVQLRLTPSAPVYACVVDGSGKQLFGGTLSTSQSFKAKRIRMNLGRPDVRVTISKKRLKIPPGSNPVGYDLRAGKKARPLPLGQRPNC
jgi:transcriptional regulator with XRE-family HTH domain